VANLESLADALPDTDDPSLSERGSRNSRGAALREQANVSIIQRKSIKSRPGALKRREKVDQGERERFAKNLAEMSGKNVNPGESSIAPDDGQQTHSRWAALRDFISQTMERKPEMKEAKI
jgi:Ribosome biogenesis protein SLX9